ncbi:unnamed protein product, partial [marine sediment metagenome]
DPGPDYFGRKANKAVVVRGERPGYATGSSGDLN